MVKDTLLLQRGVWRLMPAGPWDRAVPSLSRAERSVPLGELLSKKENNNIAIAGGSGTGKTTLLCSLLQSSPCPTLLFCLKERDLPLRLPDRVLVDVSTFLPDPFVDKDAFVTAYMLTYPIMKIGVQASLIPTLVGEAWDNSKSWREFLSVLGEMAGHGDSMKRGTCAMILSRFENEIVPKNVSVKGFAWDFTTDTTLSFENLTDPQRTFFAELSLRNLWADVKKKARGRFVVAVDEAHLILRQSASAYCSVLDEMARKVRSLDGSLVVCSQNLSDIYPDVLNQFATQFVFRTSHPGDVKHLRDQNRYLPGVVASLSATAFEFIDLRCPTVAASVPVLSLANLPDYLPEPPKPVRGKTVSLVEKREVLTETDIESLRADVLAIVSKRASYASAIARTLSDRYPSEQGKLKMRVYSVLKEMFEGGLVDRLDVVDRFGNVAVWYAVKAKGEGLFHKGLVASVRAVLEACRANFKLLGKPGQPDLVVKKVAIEVETGLKSDLSSFAVQVQRRLKVFDKCWVIVPNVAQVARFRDALSGLHGTKILTLRELNEGSVQTVLGVC